MKKTLKQSADHVSDVRLNDRVVIGGNAPITIMAGPCAVESLEQIEQTAQHLSKLGVGVLRGGAFKPRTSPYTFQGMGLEGLKILKDVGQRHNLAVISEVMSCDQVAMAEDYLDCYQVGSRNMQNFELLKTLGRTNKPVLLKRGLCATIEEWIMSAEYIMSEGNDNVILCERGIRSYDSATRNVLDINAVTVLKGLTHLPVIIDPSHAAGRKDLILPASRAAVAIGADALIVEAHPVPEESVSDKDQALSFDDLTQLVREVEPVALAIGRRVDIPHPHHVHTHAKIRHTVPGNNVSSPEGLRVVKCQAG